MGVKRSSPLLRNRLHILLKVKIDMHSYTTQTEVINLAMQSETHNPQVVGPTSFHFISNGDLMPIADGDGEDLLGIGNSQLGHASSSPVPEEYGIQTARGRPVSSSTSSPKAKSTCRSSRTTTQGHPSSTQNLVHQVRDCWRSQSYSALHYQ